MAGGRSPFDHTMLLLPCAFELALALALGLAVAHAPTAHDRSG